ncbi:MULTISPECIES: (2Fe-2S) ferredoxin domain-containing protein [unclassified Roseofilum]|uniref:(2Fe-2S) ferredoxin domain-containing protein n=1 Tax=unclassified Roseofilum TaxID=2620099 RepID=UPI001B2A710A|nr:MULTISPECIES: (2Fe-2S) ferredoxin domain-containing protein [unclassified Roseofilum]MBP0006944.1 (2Fe-2S) ferredoxin domain-containing protein [Roseofilum sp. Belize Diploria]MBP0013448.1 (2Fe-2S) ferredoxin domain-containing protein [Roseofilum sp. SID3]MBP0023032.1 (2Fe-2S) ferredoxin domain-containing protein [Roseofilum sp. SID2]MBP0032851.1 (2Fe-2S) ferredoxin domain-containing protein [Roseofilum sp. Belize BBD 4]MBP0040263.1 (2Fe-2S) ferredoxin domain-containing protein [Roseofilum 
MGKGSENSPEELNCRYVWLCQHESCTRQGSAQVLAAFEAYASETLKVEVVGCQGQCNLAPTVRVLPDETWYCRVKPEDVAEIVESHLLGGETVQRLLHPRIHWQYQYYSE